ncbi:nitroreductase family protein [Hazenella sp. IB182357]|uniref:Nitroreductase family protein n=1 Tax=Polycladospora coralii TaxID=2771432 RepID=A0A926NAP8_9BACL|nr:nitroreductase family protein [Polycladospora coralii]MBD1372612.1 nitroreductase family protein [Polycladospora coralii]MBS7531281.1 nitroreductase family protein [Polycladospora coralii]
MTTKNDSKQDYFDKIKEIKVSDEKPEPLTDQNFFTVAKERSSIRHYDPEHKMTESELREILETAILAPSSSNIQPWRFLVIQDQSLKEQLLPIANNQQQIVDASAIIAVLSDVEGYKKAEDIYGGIVKAGRMTEEIKDFYVNQIHQHYGNLSPAEATRVAMIDGGLVSMQLMLAAKAKGYDTVPMGGFDPVQFVKLFHVPAQYEPVMLIAIGKATQAGFGKVRLSVDEVTSWNKY